MIKAATNDDKLLKLLELRKTKKAFEKEKKRKILFDHFTAVRWVDHRLKRIKSILFLVLVLY